MTMPNYGRGAISVQAKSLDAQCRAFVFFVYAMQVRNHGAPVVLTPADIRWLLDIPEKDQIRVRQELMRSGFLRLSDCDGRWGYSVEVGR